MHVYMHVYMYEGCIHSWGYTWMYVHMCVEAQGRHRVFLDYSLPHSLRHSLSVERESTANLASLVQVSLAIILQVLGLQMAHHFCLTFTWVLRVWAWVLELTWQAPCLQIHFSSLRIHFSNLPVLCLWDRNAHFCGELTDLARLAGQWASGNFLFCPLNTRITNVLHHICIFLVGLGTELFHACSEWPY